MGGADWSLPFVYIAIMLDSGAVRKAMNSIISKVHPPGHCIPLEMEQRQLVCAFVT